MKSTKTIIGISLCSMLLFIVACVTINIYFPAEKVRSVAKDIVKEVRGTKGNSKDLSKDKSSFLKYIPKLFSPATAFAEDATSVSNPTIRALKERLRQRFLKMKIYYKKGLLKELDNGYVAITGTKGLNLKEKRDLKNLVRAENRDRKELYAAVAKALGISTAESDKVAKIFAEQWKRSVQ